MRQYLGHRGGQRGDGERQEWCKAQCNKLLPKVRVEHLCLQGHEEMDQDVLHFTKETDTIILSFVHEGGGEEGGGSTYRTGTLNAWQLHSKNIEVVLLDRNLHYRVPSASYKFCTEKMQDIKYEHLPVCSGGIPKPKQKTDWAAAFETADAEGGTKGVSK